MAEMQYVIQGQGREITNLKNTVKNQCDKINTLEMELISPNLTKNDEEKDDLKNSVRTDIFISKIVHDAKSKTKGHNPLRKTFARRCGANIAFSAYLDHNLEHLTTGHIIKCNQPLLNVGNAYSTITGLFTVPQTGVYLLTFTINSHRDDDTEQLTYVKLVSDNRNIIDAVNVLNAQYSEHMGGNTAIVQLTEGESVWLEVFGTTNGQLQSDDNYRYVSFSGVFLF